MTNQSEQPKNNDSSPSANRDTFSLNDINKIKEQRIRDTTNTIIGHLNINQMFDLFLLTESKSSSTFPSNVSKQN